MKIAVLGGGFTGLAAAYDLAVAGHDIVVYEQGQTLGGLAQGFKADGWDWYLERAYHHLFSNDSDMLGLAADVGFNDIFFVSPETSSLYKTHNYRTFPLDTPQDLLRFPLLSFPERIRAGLVLGYLKFFPFQKAYEQISARDFLYKYMGKHAYEVLFGELFRKKFGKYAGNILTSFIWARITKRTKNLGYVKGGFQTFIDHLESVVTDKGVDVRKGTAVQSIKKKGDSFIIASAKGKEGKSVEESYDKVVSTLPTPVMAKLGEGLFPEQFTNNLRKLEYLHAVCLILETKKPVLNHTYWLNICVPELPAMLVAQHTNLVGAAHYGGHHLLYMANYVERSDRLVAMTDKQILDHYVPQLTKINPAYEGDYSRYFIFKAPFAQPIFDKTFVKYKPDFETPVKGFYIANLDMTYPYDRGTNYAVKLGRQVAGMI